MHKIIRRVINHNYAVIKPDSIVVGSIINFDCYIKRFGDFVIIIERGTLISPELAHKVQQNDKLYISVHEKEAFKSYKKLNAIEEEVTLTIEMVTLSNIVPQIMNAKEKYDSLTNNLTKIELAYNTTALLMEAIFNETTEDLPLGALDICVNLIVESLGCEKCNLMPNILRLMPDEYSTHNHSTNVAMFSIILGSALGLRKSELILLAYAALMHDIGKIRIDQELLLKPSALDESEYALVQTHSNAGVEILQKNGIENPKILEGVLYHHEKLDGQGYPAGLHGKRIPRFARIIGMCDVFDALTTRRTYRTNYSSYEALLLMKEQMKSQFDVQYSDTFIRLLAAS